MSALILAGLLLASSQVKPSTQAEVADICSLQNFSQVAFGNCLEAYVEESAARLSKAEGNVAARIANWDEDARYRAQARSALATSNTEFLRFRARECGLASALAGGSEPRRIRGRRAVGAPGHSSVACGSPARRRCEGVQNTPRTAASPNAYRAHAALQFV
jgi:uncharacterized protein YecT (DUF1311 family)